jgi:hypothetical protein
LCSVAQATPGLNQALVIEYRIVRFRGIGDGPTALRRTTVPPAGGQPVGAETGADLEDARPEILGRQHRIDQRAERRIAE